jgi:hypothetical protein
MEAKRTRWLALALALGIGLGLLILILPGGRARAGNPGGESPSQSLSSPSVFAASPGVGGDILNISGSGVEVAGFGCYEAGKTQALCFTVYNGSTDAEWLDGITVTFPTGPLWDASCGIWDTVDSSGSPVSFACKWTTPGNRISFIDSDKETPPIGEISAGSSWGFCAQVDIPPGYSGPQPISWELSGDGDGSPPHKIAGEMMIEECMPLMLNPSSVTVEGCNGTTQTLTFELWNHHAGNGIFDLGYYVPSGNAALTGPPDFYLSQGDVVSFTVELVPDLCLGPGEQVTASIEALGSGGGDFSTIEQTLSLLSGWRTLPYTSPVPSMDSAVVWASHADGGLWVVGGYGSNGAVQRYDPTTGVWDASFRPETDITPTIEYPMDGCYGLNGDGDEIVVLFPDTIVTGSLHIYNISQDSWTAQPVPAWYPKDGRWGQDIVSLLNTPGVNENVCYLSGGSTQAGGGRTRDLWVYYPADPDGGHYISPGFPGSHPFNFHASWYVPWVGAAGSICVAGGIDHNSQINDVSQCYDLDGGFFRTPNGDLGPLPEPWWGMADGWQIYQGQYQIWMANGVAQDGTLLPISAYASAEPVGFQNGPEVPVGLYRVEGDGWMDSFYMIGGSTGGFSYSRYNQLLVKCPWCSEVFAPLIFRNN